MSAAEKETAHTPECSEAAKIHGEAARAYAAAFAAQVAAVRERDKAEAKHVEAHKSCGGAL